jgi:aryl carrier-like protein
MDLICDDSEELTNDEPLMDAGLDSLAAIAFTNCIRKEGCPVYPTLMFDYPTIREISSHINEQIGGDTQASGDLEQELTLAADQDCPPA